MNSSTCCRTVTGRIAGSLRGVKVHTDTAGQVFITVTVYARPIPKRPFDGAQLDGGVGSHGHIDIVPPFEEWLNNHSRPSGPDTAKRPDSIKVLYVGLYSER